MKSERDQVPPVISSPPATPPFKRRGSAAWTGLMLGALLAATVLGLMTNSTPTDAQQAKKPRVPIGIDPGGVMVAIATDTGIDYSRPEIAKRLARDGEGELIGWDFVDEDRKPFAARGSPPLATDLARAILAETPSARLAVFRAKAGDKIALGKLVVYAARSQSRIALLTSASAERSDWEAFAEAMAHFKGLLVIVPSEAGAAPYPAALGLDRILTVTATESANTPVLPNQRPADLAINAGGQGAAFAAARLAALAARIIAAEPLLEGAALKARILGLATPLSEPLAGPANPPR